MSLDYTTGRFLLSLLPVVGESAIGKSPAPPAWLRGADEDDVAHHPSCLTLPCPFFAVFLIGVWEALPSDQPEWSFGHCSRGLI